MTLQRFMLFCQHVLPFKVCPLPRDDEGAAVLTIDRSLHTRHPASTSTPYNRYDVVGWADGGVKVDERNTDNEFKQDMDFEVQP